MSTIFHSNYYAHELTRRFSSEKFEKLSQSLFNATVDLNPHQIKAALFAFRSPLSRGAILADEVGLVVSLNCREEFPRTVDKDAPNRAMYPGSEAEREKTTVRSSSRHGLSVWPPWLE